MRLLLILSILLISLSLKAHYPIDRIQIIGLSELIVTGSVVSNHTDFFHFKVDSVIRGTLYSAEILIRYQKDELNIIRSKDSNYFENYNTYECGQKLMLFLRSEKIENSESIWSSVGNYDEAELKIQNDTIVFGSSVYSAKEKYLINDFIDAVTHFEDFFEIELSDEHHSIIIKQIVSAKKLKNFNKSNCHDRFLKIIIDYNRLHKWKRNGKWMKTIDGYLPYNGKYELVNPSNNQVEYTGKCKRGRHVEHNYVGSD